MASTHGLSRERPVKLSLGAPGDCVAHFASNGQLKRLGQHHSCIRLTDAPSTACYPVLNLLFLAILYMCVFVTVTVLRIVDDGDEEATYLLTYLLTDRECEKRTDGHRQLLLRIL